MLVFSSKGIIYRDVDGSKEHDHEYIGVLAAHKQEFAFDRVFSPELLPRGSDSSTEIYNICARPVVKAALMDRYQGTIFAYGKTDNPCLSTNLIFTT